MIVEKTPFKGLVVITSRVLKDDRGYFLESWNANVFAECRLDYEFVQDNLSTSKANVIRGLHFQVEPMAQGKLVRVVKGAVLDVAVDLRKDQPTFGQHFKFVLDSVENKMLFIPPGFAHGFRSLEDETILFYKCTKPYSKNHERVIKWNDPTLAIDWGISEALVSERDSNAPSLNKFLQSSNI